MYCPVCGSERGEGNICKNCNYVFGQPIRSDNSVKIVAKPKVSTTSEFRVGGFEEQRKDNQVEPEKATKESSKKKKIIVIIVVAVVVGSILLGCLGAGVGYLVYVNSDEYKIEQAVIYISDGNYKEGLRMISDVGTEEAETLRGFVNVLVAKDEYLEAVAECNEEQLYEISVYDDFKTAVDEFEQSYEAMYLDGSLAEEYERITGSFELVEKLYTEDFRYALVNAQSVQLNMVDRYRSKKGGPYFTVASFQDRIGISGDAIADLAENYKICCEDFEYGWYIAFDYSEVVEYCYYEERIPNEYWIRVSASTQDMCSNILYNCEDEINYCNTKIEGWLEKFDADDELYIIEPDFDYTSYMGEYLEEIAYYSDTEDNATTVVTCLKMDALFFLICGETPDGDYTSGGVFYSDVDYY